MDAIKTGSIGDVDQAFRKVVLTWLQQEYDVKRHGKPSWRRLLECIGSPSGGSNFALAMRLAGHHQGITIHCFEFYVPSYFYLNKQVKRFILAYYSGILAQARESRKDMIRVS